MDLFLYVFKNDTKLFIIYLVKSNKDFDGAFFHGYGLCLM